MESEYFNNIIHIRDKNKNVITSKDRCSIKKITSIYSNTKTPIFKLIIDDTPISRNNTYTVKYKCQTCNCEKEITLNLYIRKINKNVIHCDTCKNKDEDKCKKQSEFMKKNISEMQASLDLKRKQGIKDVKQKLSLITDNDQISISEKISRL